MPSLTIKNLPLEVHAELKRRARDHRRSLNQEVVDILARESGRRPVDVEALLADIREHRKLWKGPPLTDEEIDAAKREGRP